MRTELIEIYSDATNAAVMRHPGRQFPGMLIQGDTLYSLSRSIAVVPPRQSDERLCRPGDCRAYPTLPCWIGSRPQGNAMTGMKLLSVVSALAIIFSVCLLYLSETGSLTFLLLGVGLVLFSVLWAATATASKQVRSREHMDGDLSG
ncbi:DUF6959 family protein [Sphingomonas kyeonggiensis]|uniref:DUF6959 family protein n=1 Tax=Sphingomonas kyeonggiensis TaxID=1268553 RepID=UPI003CCCE4E8